MTKICDQISSDFPDQPEEIEPIILSVGEEDEVSISSLTGECS